MTQLRDDESNTSQLRRIIHMINDLNITINIIISIIIYSIERLLLYNYRVSILLALWGIFNIVHYIWCVGKYMCEIRVL